MRRVKINYRDIPSNSHKPQILRFRLSRKQLPAVDVNGNVIYSTPSGESEVEWLARGSATSHSGRSSRELSENAPDHIQRGKSDFGDEIWRVMNFRQEPIMQQDEMVRRSGDYKNWTDSPKVNSH